MLTAAVQQMFLPALNLTPRLQGENSNQWQPRLEASPGALPALPEGSRPLVAGSSLGVLALFPVLL